MLHLNAPLPASTAGFAAWLGAAALFGAGAALSWLFLRHGRRQRRDLERDVAERTSELMAVNTQLMLAMEQAQTASKAKSAFLANMSHELRTPLNAILLYSELATEDARERGDSGLVTDLGKIQGAGRHLLTMIDDVLDLARLEAGRMTLNPEPTDLHALLVDLSEQLKPVVAKRSNRFDLNLDPFLGSHVVDAGKVRQIVANLVSNAAKFTEGGEVSLQVTAPQGRLRIVVKDTGIGLDAGQAQRLFQAFAQGDEGTAKKHGGAGLGLALAQRLVEFMGGELGVESEPGRGATFTVDLPLGASAPVQPRVVQSLPRKAKALVIDDDPLMRDMLVRALTREGLWVGSAASGEEGLALAQALAPDIITLDLLMEGMDGYEVLGRLKQDPATADIPVVLISMTDDRAQGFALGAAEFLQKPVTQEDLSGLLERFRKGSPPHEVLVVEDDDATRSGLVEIIRRSGWSALEAADGVQALDYLRTRTPRLVLLDLMLPKLDGFGLVAEFQKHPTWRSLPVVVLSSKDPTPEERAQLAVPQVHRVLRKGAQGRNELMAVVREIVQGKLQG